MQNCCDGGLVMKPHKKLWLMKAALIVKHQLETNINSRTIARSMLAARGTCNYETIQNCPFHNGQCFCIEHMPYIRHGKQDPRMKDFRITVLSLFDTLLDIDTNSE